MRNKLFFRLTILYATAFILVAMLSFFIFYWRLHQVTMARLDEELVAETEHYAQVLKKSGLARLKVRIITQFEPEDRHEEFIRLIDFNGITLAATDLSGWPTIDKDDAAASLKRDGTQPVLATIDSPDSDYRARMVSAVIAPNTILQIGESLEDVDDYLEIFRSLLIILTSISILVAAVIGWVLARRALADMQPVSLTAEQIASGAYDSRVEIKGQFDEIKNLGQTFNTMLDITEAEAGVNGSRQEEFDAAALVLEACELFRPLADDRRIKLQTEVAAPILFCGDKKKMQRIVTNVIENAIKYTPANGKIIVRAVIEAGKIQITVNDSGIGIAQDDLPHIFECFYRCDSSRSQGGVGLGLSLAKAYTESMRGLINVKSTLGHGSTFILQFDS